MPILGIDHYNLRGDRATLDRLCSFYADVVGLRVGPRPQMARHGYWLYAGENALLHLSEVRPGETRDSHVTGTFDHVAFACRGWDETLARLNRHGIEYRVSDLAPPEPRQIFFSDPQGNGIELNFARNALG